MSDLIGNAAFRYRAVGEWGELPEGWELGDIGGIGVDRQDRVYVFHRGEHPMIVFSPEGKFLNAWGKGLFPRAHGIHMAPDDTIFCTDDADHTVRKFTLDGKLLLQIGVSGQFSPRWSGRPFKNGAQVRGHRGKGAGRESMVQYFDRVRVTRSTRMW